ncbi:MAG: proton-conducting transporter transmembrane domain-containing protein [Candidatus Loosdrechtia sp.]|uniref:proton-conducting transporter transmembrane domain-containing protein n=1 Tax=Candidatus Loosdrechtia sp. TaxID=3101272 RepID=UPI003A659336|nr:MAG: proton-conducting transporter membrane subunit [Candidatus Jettenia sp. AMX2]
MEYLFALEIRPVAAILVSILAVILILASSKRPNLREFWTLAASVVKIAIVFSMLPAVLSGHIIETTPFYLSKEIYFHLRVDAAGMLFAGLASILWLLTSVFSIGYMRRLKEKHQTGYYASFALALSSVMGIAFSANLLTFFIFYEILTLATYPLVVHKRTKEAVNAGRKYLAYTLAGGQVLLAGIVGVYMLGGDVSFRPGGILNGEMASLSSLRILFFLLFTGVAVKAGVMPFHGWLPTAMIAPTPVSALLHAVAVVKAGAFGIYRIVGYTFGPELFVEIGAAAVVTWLATFTIIASSLIAMRHDHLKRRLAYSTIGQLSYIVLGISFATQAGSLGAGFHIPAHAFMKITLFFCAGAIYAGTGLDKISAMRGLGKKMPFTFIAFTVCSLGIAGLPLLAGFVSKFNLTLSALESGQGLFIAVLIASALLSMSYLLPVVQMAFFRIGMPDFSRFPDIRIAGAAMLIPLLLTALFSFILGTYPDFLVYFYRLALIAANSVTAY